MSVEVIAVTTRRERETWLRLPWKLYKDDPAWIPNLLILQREVIDPKKNPFFEHGEVQLFLALRDGIAAGRISAHVDRLHNQVHSERTGFFGFFESEDDDEVAGALIEAAAAWIRGRGMESLRGPFNFSINEELGILIDGFEYPPMIAMTHSLPYYDAVLKATGLDKVMDLYAYHWEIKEPPERMKEAVAKARAVPGLVVRKVRMSKLREEVDVLLDIFNETWQNNWGFVAATEREANKMASDLRLIADPAVALIAEVNGEPAGMVVALPNFYETIRDFKGFINPINAIKLIWRLKVRGPETGRLLLFGVKPKFRTRGLHGLPFLLLNEVYEASRKRRYRWCEESWVLENNARLNALMPHWDAYVYKRYRIYEKAI